MIRKLLLLLIPLLAFAQVDQATVKHVLAKMRSHQFSEFHVYYLDADSVILVYARGDSADFDTIRFNHLYGDFASIDTINADSVKTNHLTLGAAQILWATFRDTSTQVWRDSIAKVRDNTALDTLKVNNIFNFATTWADTNSFGKTKTTDTLELSGMTEGDIFKVQFILCPG